MNPIAVTRPLMSDMPTAMSDRVREWITESGLEHLAVVEVHVSPDDPNRGDLVVNCHDDRGRVVTNTIRGVEPVRAQFHTRWPVPFPTEVLDWVKRSAG